MALPKPERGLVIAYAYLWHAEHEQGREDGAKDRPCVIVLAVEAADTGTVVTVLPVTHAEPLRLDTAVEIPLATKRRLGLDDARSWVIVSEGNRFVWPGPDLRPTASGHFHYGVLPPALFQKMQAKFKAYFFAQRRRVVTRTD